MIPTAPKPAIPDPFKEGVFRVALAGTIALLLAGLWSSSVAGVANLATSMLLILSLLLVIGRPKAIVKGGFMLTALDFLWVSLLVFFTGAGDSPFYPLYLLAALGVARIPSLPVAVAATFAGTGGYLAAVALAGGTPSAVGTGLYAGYVALFCGFAWVVGTAFRRAGDRVSEADSALAAERVRAEQAEDLAPKFGPALRLSDLDGILRWTLDAAIGVTGGSYAHVAGLDGIHHRTVCEADFDACPTWWHPTIQRLVLWSCRDNKVMRADDSLHGIEGFLAAPIGPEGGEKWGAVIVGGKRFGAAEERTLKLLASAVGPALAGSGDAPAGREPVTGLPNRYSLHRTLDVLLNRRRALTVLMAGLDGFREHERTHGPDAGDDLLRRVGSRLEEGNRRSFRYGESMFVVVQTGAGASSAREAALALQWVVSQAAAECGGASVGFVTVEPGEGDPYLVVEAAERSLAEARKRPEGVAGSAVSVALAQPGQTGRRTEVAQIVLALAEASEFRGPYVGEHSKSVAEISRRVGERLSLPREQMPALELGSLLHDLGKIGIPDYVLCKPGRLTEEEHELMKRHPLIGARILGTVAELAPALPAVWHHHERFDGNGYPDGLSGEDIPLVARIVSVADAFDSLVRDRIEGQGVSEEEALQEIERNAGTQFDPRVVRAFMEEMRRSDDRLAGSAG